MGLSTFNVTAATPGVPTVLTLSSPQVLPTGMSMGIGGGTGAWAAINGIFQGAYVSPNQVSIPIDSTGFGALTGTVQVFFYTAVPNQSAVIQLARPLVNQIIAIVQRDQVAFIAAVNPSLRPIQEFHKGPRVRVAMPWMTVGYRSTDFDDSWEQIIKEGAQIDINLETGAFDSELSQDAAMDYLVVLDGILRSAGPPYAYTDWVTPLPIVHESVPFGLTSPLPVGSIKQILIAREDLDVVIRQGQTRPVMSVTIELHVHFAENLVAGTNA